MSKRVLRNAVRLPSLAAIGLAFALGVPAAASADDWRHERGHRHDRHEYRDRHHGHHGHKHWSHRRGSHYDPYSYRGGYGHSWAPWLRGRGYRGYDGHRHRGDCD
jgi:hypothetical protein